MRILIIEDDISTSKSLENLLTVEGFLCDTTDMGQEGLDVSKLYEYDLVILDVMLPDMDGFDVLRRMRSANLKTPVLLLSGLDAESDKLRGFRSGADDYLTKPFSKSELVARIHAIVRRANGHSDSVVQTGNLKVDLHNRYASVNGHELNLTGKEYAILELLSMRKGATLTKEMFLNHLYGGIDEPELKIIDVFICKLRRKIAEAEGDDSCIETIWGRGYVLRDPSAENHAV